MSQVCRAAIEGLLKNLAHTGADLRQQVEDEILHARMAARESKRQRHILEALDRASAALRAKALNDGRILELSLRRFDVRASRCDR